MFSQEFFIQRSFEVVWAVFRVAEHATRPKIKQALEDKAVDYLTYKDLATLDDLEEIVRLSAQIKDINKVNSSVLLREIGSLRSAILELNDCKARMLVPAKNPETAPNIEESFSRPPMRISEIIRSISDSINKSKPENSPAREMSEKIESGNPSFAKATEGKESGKVNEAQFSKAAPLPIVEKESTVILEKKEVFFTSAPKQNSPARSVESPARATLIKTSDGEKFGNPSFAKATEGKESGNESKANTGRFEAVIGFKERNDILIKLMSKRTLCHIKDVLQSMPGISERTVRYDVQRLVDKGVIERIGTGGPNSFFRLKK